MVEPVIISGFLALIGGTAGLVVVGSVWGIYQNWQQTREYKRHTDLLIRILFELREMRGDRGSG